MELYMNKYKYIRLPIEFSTSQNGLGNIEQRTIEN